VAEYADVDHGSLETMATNCDNSLSRAQLITEITPFDLKMVMGKFGMSSITFERAGSGGLGGILKRVGAPAGAQPTDDDIVVVDVFVASLMEPIAEAMQPDFSDAKQKVVEGDRKTVQSSPPPRWTTPSPVSKQPALKPFRRSASPPGSPPALARAAPAAGSPPTLVKSTPHTKWRGPSYRKAEDYEPNAEWQAGKGRLGGGFKRLMTSADRTELLRVYADVNQNDDDTVLSRTELQRCLADPRMQAVMKRRNNFGLTTDRHGAVDSEELWNMIDTNGDGEMSITEFLSVGRR
jgi:hypothetical protein